MTKTDLTIRRCVHTLFILFCFGFWGASLSAQCPAMSCNDNVQISLGNPIAGPATGVACAVSLTADMLLEGDETTQGTSFTITINGTSISSQGLPIAVTGNASNAGPGVYYLSEGTYSYSVGNQCGNSCWGQFILENNLPAITQNCDCPPGNTDPDCQFVCTEEDWIVNNSGATAIVPVPTFSGNCGEAVSTTPVDQASDMTLAEVQAIFDSAATSACGYRKVRRTWNVTTTAHGGTSTSTLCTQEFYLEPVDLTDLTCPANLKGADSLPCGIKDDPKSIADYIAGLPGNDADDGLAAAYPHLIDGAGKVSIVEDFTCNVGATYSDQVIKLCGSGDTESKKIIRNWTILDWCNGQNTRTCIQIIEIKDTEGPQLHDIPTAINTSTAPWSCVASYQFENLNFTDNCSGVGEVGYVIETLAGAVVSSGSGSSTSNLSITGVGAGNYNLFLTAADNCEASSKIGPIPFNVNDAIPPIAISDDALVVSLTGTPEDGTGVAKVFATSVDAGSFDACGPVTLEVRRDDEEGCDFAGNETFSVELVPDLDASGNVQYDAAGEVIMKNIDTDNGEFVKFCCADLTDVDATGTQYGEHKVWLRVTDGAGNTNLTWTIIRVENKLRPSLTCPPDITISCLDDNSPNNTGTAVTTAACAGVGKVGYTDDSTGTNGCGNGNIYRSWFIDNNMDGAPDTGSPICVQTITVGGGDLFTGCDIDFPDDKTTNCTDASANDVPTWDESGTCALVGYSLKSDTFYFEEGACVKILNRWSVIDWCQYDPNVYGPVTSSTDPVAPGNRCDYLDADGNLVQYQDVWNSAQPGLWTSDQVIKVVDNDAPTFDDCGEKIIVAVNGENCTASGVTIDKVATDSGDCPSPWLKWEIQLDLDSDWDVDYTFRPATTASGQSVNLALVTASGAPIALNANKHRIVFRVTDGCGNVTVCTNSLVVEDTKAPTPYCIQSLSTAVMEEVGYLDIWAIDFNLNSEDNCTPKADLQYSFSGDVIDNSVRVSCVGGGGDYEITNGISETFTLKMWVWDAGSDINHDGVITIDERNRDYCFVTLRVDDNLDTCPGVGTGVFADIAGTVMNEEGNTIEEAAVQLNSDRPEYPTEYMTDELGEYTFGYTPMYDDYDVSVTKDDIHVNGVSTLDLVLIQRHVLGIESLDSPYKYLAADVNNSQSISAADLVEMRRLILGINTEFTNNESWRFVDAQQTFTNPTNPWPFNESLDIDNLQSNMMAENFIGVKVGDVNGNAQLNNYTETEVRSAISFDAQNQAVKAGETVTLTMNSTEIKDLHGLQFTMSHKGLTFKDVTAEQIIVNENNVAPFEGYLSFSWNQDRATDVTDGIVSFVFEATEDLNLSEAVSLNSRIAAPEIYVGENPTAFNLNLNFGDQSTATEVVLLQNEPNPFAESTMVSFILPKSMDATLSVFDVSGKKVYQLNDTFNRGVNTIQLTKAMIQVEGLLYYQLEAGKTVQTKKMVVIR